MQLFIYLTIFAVSFMLGYLIGAGSAPPEEDETYKVEPIE